MPDFRTHYDNLKISEQADSEELRLAFKNLFLRFHPGNHPGNSKRSLGYLRIIKESYSILSDPIQRKAHDSWIAEKRVELGIETSPATETDSRIGNRHYSWKFLISALVLVILVYFGSTFLNLDDYPLVSMLESSDEADPEYQFNFKNQCRYPVTLAIRYWGLDEEWHKAGWWDVEPGDLVFLEDSDGNRLISENAIWYYYARTIGGDSIEWAGEFPFIFNGKVLQMIELQDTSGDSDWSVSCDANAPPGALGSPPH